MLVDIQHGPMRGHVERARLSIDNGRFFAIAFGMEALTIIAVSILTGALYHLSVYGQIGPVRDFVAVGTLMVLLFTLPFIFRGQYTIETFTGGKRTLALLLNYWAYAFLTLGFLGFLTKTIDMMSRGWMVMFFVGGLLAVACCDAVLARSLRAGWRSGRVAARRVLVIGTQRDVAQFKLEHATIGSGTEVVASAILTDYQRAAQFGHAELREALAAGVDLARQREASDVVVLVGWEHGQLMSRITDNCMDLPAAIHLGHLGAVGRYPGLDIDRVGQMTTVTLVKPPLSLLQVLSKRAFDIVVASIALLLLSPVLLIVAFLVKRDSQGPVFFRQRRRGFNHREFQIWKFRTMTTMDDGDCVMQARENDVRITRIGAVLRKTNIDELPQLLNVISGQMSLVGPRPHAVAHDKHYERCIERYARRLNVKPGITGWAQINGCRGLTETDKAMRDRVAHDLYYIDNWSILLDVYILAMTAMSPRAYRNAN